ncbi:MAG: FecR domain-containing protein [Candidatus Pseudobacter hemicellulosilyticus]|uniref:FecR domain-containing protein n=1 Tax=Candidatus Pseudobacter hemicellulosilyticus TaxID=3121375 RepID=A0AAJ6BGK9_9BACT|nr:MAG: FecR domain-containing protein [Pseudobacter sp.]
MLSPLSIQVILEKYLHAPLNEAEQAVLQQWLAASADNQALFDRINKEDYVRESLQQLDQFNAARILQKIDQGREQAAVVYPADLSRRKMGWAAAVLLAALGGASFLLARIGNQPSANNPIAQNGAMNIAPGKEGAILTLSDGSTMVLDSLGQGTITTQGNTHVVLKNGQLSYEKDHGLAGATQEPFYNTMSTPRGRQYQVVLPDGSRVWLNAASSITFPTAFTGGERRVRVSGEAYFEIKADPRNPFRVEMQEQVVEVLGTSFNINGYSDETTIKTTLLDGSVRLTSGNGAKPAVLLRPGEQAGLQKPLANANPFTVSEADLEEVMAWKNGVFSFHEADIRTVMRQIERWYDIRVDYRGTVPQDRFSGKVSRSANLSQVLRILELSEVNFHLDGNTLIVTPPQDRG